MLLTLLMNVHLIMPPLGFSLSKYASVLSENVIQSHYLYKKRCFTCCLKNNRLTRQKVEAQAQMKCFFVFKLSLFCGLFAFSASLLGLNVSAPLSDDNMTLLVSGKKNCDMSIIIIYIFVLYILFFCPVF